MSGADLHTKLRKSEQQLKASQARVAYLEGLLVDQANARPLEANSKQQFAILDHLIEGCQVIGFDWRYLYINDVTAQQGHQPREALIGYTMMEKYPGIETTPMFAVLRRSMEERTVERLQNEFTYPDGSQAWFELRIQPVPEGIFILSLDTSQQKQAEQALKRYAQRMEILHQIDLGLIQGSSIQALVEATLQHLRQLIPCQRADVTIIDGITGEALVFAAGSDTDTQLGAGVRVPIPSNVFEGYDARHIRVFDDIRLFQDTRPRARQLVSEGLLTALSALIMDRERPIGALGFFADKPGAFTAEHQEIAIEVASQLAIAIHQMQLSDELERHTSQLEQRVSERTAELQAAKKRVEAILNSSVDGILLIDLDFTIQQANAAFSKLFACETDAYFNQPLTMLVPAEEADHLTKMIQARLPKDQYLEVRARRQDGTEFDAEFSIGSINQGGFVCTIRDITARKQSEEALKVRLDQEHEFQDYLKALHEITIELTQTDNLDIFYRRTVELGLERLGFDRLALFLYNAHDGTAVGTYGTDAEGKLLDERHIRFVPDANGIMLRALGQTERFYYDEHVPLYNNLNPSGFGWNAATVLWNGTQSLGWLVADNLLRQTPASKPRLDILGLYSLTIGTLLAQKQVQLALRESEIRYRLLAENITDVIVRVTLKGVYLYASPSCKTVLGYEPQDVIGKSIHDFIHPNDIEIVRRARQESLEQSSATPLTYRFRHQQGHYLWLEVVRQLIRSDDTDEIQGYIASARDVTDRKQAEDALKRNEQLLRIMLDSLPVGVSMLDTEGNITLGNPAGQQLWAGSKNMNLDQSGEYKAWRLDTGKQVEQHEWAAARALAQGETSINEELEIEAFDGTHKYILNSGIPIRDEQGHILGALTVNQDITEIKQISAELERQRTFLRQVIDVSPSMIFVKDYNARFVLANPMVAKMYDTTVDALLGKTDADFNPSLQEVDAFLEADRRVINSGEPLFLEEPITAHTGETRWLQTTKVPIVSAAGKFVLGVATDITERKKSEATLQQAFEKEKELGDLKTRFVSMASHEFRTPLATILALTETLMAYRQKLSDAQIEQRLGKIQDQIGHLKDIMEDVLLLARMQARRVEFNPVKVNLDGLCRSVMDEFQSRTDIAHKFFYTCDERLYEVTLDKKLMRQIINNLVSNAVKYSPADKPITVSLAYESETLIFKVQDEGIGIPEADLKHLFEPFHRAANVGAISGTGLGMVITKESVELHGGTITVVSQVGVGTTFTVNIPLK
jgi:PAS domain S-box-containing protein